MAFRAGWRCPDRNHTILRQSQSLLLPLLCASASYVFGRHGNEAGNADSGYLDFKTRYKSRSAAACTLHPAGAALQPPPLQLQVLPATDACIPHKAIRLQIWRKGLANEGGTLLLDGPAANDAPEPTHLLVGDEPLPEPETSSQALTPVHYSWIESCLRKRQRLDEADYHPAALGASAAERGGKLPAAPTAGAQPPHPAPAANASAGAGARALLRQLAVNASSLTSADVQQLLLCLLNDGPRPHWLSVHGRPSTVVLVELPGLDLQLLAERPPPLPRLLAGARQQVMLKATAANESAQQTTAALFSVMPAKGKGRKRKEPEASAGMRPPAVQQGQQAQEATPAEQAFPPAFYAATSRTMRALGWPQGCAEAAAAAEAAAEPNPDGLAAAGSGDMAAAAAQAALLPGWVSTAQRTALLACDPPGADEEQQAGCSTRQAVADGAGETLPAAEQMVACDCEMVITAAGFELARVSLVAGDGRRLLDQLVVPDNPVLDYNTEYSGITAEMLAGVTTSVADAQRLVLRHVGPQTLLAGHTLENDLRVLRLAHGRCLDSAVLFPNPRGPPFRSSLRGLAQRLLGLSIQQGAHDSCEDAEVALRLARLKLQGGPTQGTLKPGCRHLLEQLAAKGRSMALVAPREVLMQHAVPTARSAAPAASDAQGVAAALGLLGATPRALEAAAGPGMAAEAGLHLATGAAVSCGHAAQPTSLQQPAGAQPGHARAERPPDLLWLHLGDLWQHLQERAVRLAGQGGPPNHDSTVAAAAEDGAVRGILQRIDDKLAELVAALPPGGLLLLLSGQGDTPLCRTLNGDGLRRKEGAQGQQAWHAAAVASKAAQDLQKRAAHGVCLVCLAGKT